MTWKPGDYAGGPCIEWTGRLTHQGYGTVHRDTPDGIRMQRAHRFAAELCFGKEALEQAECVMHLCDNKACWNPKHLRLGTLSDNQQDWRMKAWRRQYVATQRTGVLEEGQVMTLFDLAPYGGELPDRRRGRKEPASHVVEDRDDDWEVIRGMDGVKPFFHLISGYTSEGSALTECNVFGTLVDTSGVSRMVRCPTCVEVSSSRSS